MMFSNMWFLICFLMMMVTVDTKMVSYSNKIPNFGESLSETRKTFRNGHEMGDNQRRNDKDKMSTKDKGFELLFTTNEDEYEDFEVTAERPIPTWLRGTLVRNGLGRFEIGPRRFIHAFDAYSKITTIKFTHNGKIKFSSKFLRSEGYSKSIDNDNVYPYLTFGPVEPPFGYFESAQALYNGVDNTNINIYSFGNGSAKETVTLSDFWVNYKIDTGDLSKAEKIDADIDINKLSFIPLLSTAHPLPEYGTSNDIIIASSFGIFPGRSNKLHVVRIRSSGDREVITSIDVDNVHYVHSFAATERYVIIFANPVYVSVANILKSFNAMGSLDWHKDKQTDVYVVKIKDGHVTKLQTERAFNLHHVNAYETRSGKIKVDVITYPDINSIKQFTVDTLSDRNKRNQIRANNVLKRYTIDLKLGRVVPYTFGSNIKRSKMGSVNRLDMPVINEKFRHHKYCYIYGQAMKNDGINLSDISLVKKDVCGGSRDAVWSMNNHYPTEPWFVPNPSNEIGGSSEDDGIIMSLVLDGEKEKSYLLILNAKTMKTVNKIYLPTPVPLTIHGRFFPNE
ncbi:unnamed protein product [Owenia fusiformis]|uniref:Uncharacterized protein n=1 Tax=Owenia fusiformis TaxID=6347 RepID=A0A8J1XWW1_OWEFU|nr:unnamed protein product [Owenia fusiformis]